MVFHHDHADRFHHYHLFLFCSDGGAVDEIWGKKDGTCQGQGASGIGYFGKNKIKVGGARLRPENVLMSTTLALISFALLGAPLFIIFGAIALYSFFHADIDTSAIMIEFYRMASAPSPITLPLFTFAGYLIDRKSVG